MSDVSFNEEPQVVRTSLTAHQPLLVRWVIATKLVSTQRQAEYVLIGIGVAALLLAVLLWPSGRATPENVVEVASPPGVTPGERLR